MANAVLRQLDVRTRATRSAFFAVGIGTATVDALIEQALVGHYVPPSQLFRQGFGAVELLNIVLLLIGLILIVRRAHDFASPGRPWACGFLALFALKMAPGIDDATGGWFLGLAFFPFFVALMTLYFLPGTPGPNRYGPDPRLGRKDRNPVSAPSA